ncbi:hypothetical protein HYS47_01320 [Candidatus Woesearchaeota archaeon]|nr:hypothetical protein [Candidatus Woesearchaeota archaeon]
MTYTRFTIPKRYLERLLDLAMLEHESSFLLRARQEGDALVYLDTPVIKEGRATNTSPTFIDPNDAAIRDESNFRKYVLIEGHTHPEVQGNIVRPYSCGWTLPRTPEFRDYRDAGLQQTPEGRQALSVRRTLLNQIMGEERQSERQAVLGQLVDSDPVISIANMITRDGVHYYISNRVVVHRSAAEREDIAAELRDDTCLRSGDFQGYQAMKDFSRSAVALVHAKPEHVLSPSSKEKFMLSILLLDGPGYGGAKHVQVHVMD